jgi:hypothetical protein
MTSLLNIVATTSASQISHVRAASWLIDSHLRHVHGIGVSSAAYQSSISYA